MERLAADVFHGDLLLCICGYATFATLAHVILPLNRACRDAAFVRLRNVRWIARNRGLSLHGLDEITQMDCRGSFYSRPVSAKRLVEALDAGALAKLKGLWLEDSQIGEKGLEALSGALAAGALAQLKVLSLSNTQIGNAGMTSLSDALGSGSMAQLEVLWLYGDEIGDVGIEAFANACRGKALAKLEYLNLYGNPFGDPGVTALARVCASGALAQLHKLLVDNPEHPALKAACEARGISQLY